MMCFLGTWDWIFNIGIPWGFGDSMVWGSWELGPWGLLKAVGLRGAWDMYPGVWDPQSQNGVSKFWGPPEGEIIT